MNKTILIKLSATVLVLSLSSCSDDIGIANYGDAGRCPHTSCLKVSEGCDGGERIVCADDGQARGCLVETRVDCGREIADGVCRVRDNRSLCISDFCAEVSAPCSTEGTTCDGETLVTCARDSFGCLFESRAACATDRGLRCRDVMGREQCVDPCTIVGDTCATASFCSGTTVVRCAPNEDECLIETGRTPCQPWELCTTDELGASCTDLACPAAETDLLTCGDSMVSGISSGGGATGNSWCGTSREAFAGNERIYRFVGSGRQDVSLNLSTGAVDAQAFHLFVLDGAGGSGVCDDGASCDDVGRLNPAGVSANFATSDDSVHYIVVENDLRVVGGDPTPYAIFLSCQPIACGDGRVSDGENCDDMNTISEDGCSDSCDTELGYRCVGVPSYCESANCGDGMRTRIESCDDMNLIDGDGCSSACAVEFSGSPRTEARSIPDGLLSFRRPSVDCAYLEFSSQYYFDPVLLTNPSALTMTVDITATWQPAFAGFLMAYDDTFDAAHPLRGCTSTSTEGTGGGTSELTSVTVAPGATVTIVAAGTNPDEMTSSYDLTIIAAPIP